VIYRHKTNINNYNKHLSANEDEDGSSFRIQRILLEFEIYVTQHLIDYKLAEVVGFEKG